MAAHHSIMYIMSSCPDRTCFRRPGRSPVDSEHVATVRGVGYGSPVVSFRPRTATEYVCATFPRSRVRAGTPSTKNPGMTP